MAEAIQSARPSPAAGSRRIARLALRFDGGALLFSLVAAALYCVGRAAYRGGVEAADVVNPLHFGSPWVEILRFAALAVGFYLVAALCIGLWSRPSTDVIASYGTALRRRFLPYAAVLALCWAPWVIASLPATMDQDTIWQVLIWRTPEAWYDHHPWLTTMLFGTLFDAGAALGPQSISLAIACVAQSLSFACVTSAALCYLWRFPHLRRLLWCALIACCSIPAFPFYACRLEKDTLFALGLVPFMILYVDAIRTRGRSVGSPRRVAILCLLALWLVLTKKTGVYVVAPSLLALCLRCMGGAWRPAILSCAVAVGGFCLWQWAIIPVLGVAPGPSKELYSLPFQQTARFVLLHPDEVSREEREAIDAVLPYDDLVHYQFTNADPIKDSYKGRDEAIGAYLGTWAAMGLRHPEDYALATLGTNLPLFFPLPWQCPVGTSPEWVDENVAFFSQFLTAGLSPAQIEARDELTGSGLASFGPTGGLRDVLGSYAGLWTRGPLGRLVSPAVFQLYLPLLCACCLASRRFRGSRVPLLVALVPWALIIASIIVGPVALDRYAIGALWCLPLLMFLPSMVFGSPTGPGRPASSRRSRSS